MVAKNTSRMWHAYTKMIIGSLGLGLGRNPTGVKPLNNTFAWNGTI